MVFQAHEVLLGQLLSLGLLPFGQQLADFGQVLRGPGPGVGARPSGPERGFVELNVLLPHPAENHAAQPAVADGQRVGPLRGGLGVPERQRLLGCG